MWPRGTRSIARRVHKAAVVAVVIVAVAATVVVVDVDVVVVVLPSGNGEKKNSRREAQDQVGQDT